MTPAEVIAAAVQLGYWLIRGDHSIGRRVGGAVVIVSYVPPGRVETTYKDLTEAAEKFLELAGRDR